MSLKCWVQTGLTERQWENLWHALVSSPASQLDAMALGFEEWRKNVIAEGANRQFIHHAWTGKKISARKGILEVVQEIRASVRP